MIIIDDDHRLLWEHRIDVIWFMNVYDLFKWCGQRTHTQMSALSKPIGGAYNAFKARTKRVFCKSSRKPISDINGAWSSLPHLSHISHTSVSSDNFEAVIGLKSPKNMSIIHKSRTYTQIAKQRKWLPKGWGPKSCTADYTHTYLW